MAVIHVSDTGPGLPAKAREHLFQPFQGGTRKGGFGLGSGDLAPNWSAATAAGWSWCRSSSNGTGSRSACPKTVAALDEAAE